MSKRRLDQAKIHHKQVEREEEIQVEELQGEKQRTLIFANQGISGHGRHLMNDLRLLIPNCKKESKLSSKEELHVINEMCALNSCNNCLFFEQRGNELYMWVSKAPNGPSIRFLVMNSMSFFLFIHSCKILFLFLFRKKISTILLLLVIYNVICCFFYYFIFIYFKYSFLSCSHGTTMRA